MIWVLVFICTFYAILIIFLTIGLYKVDEFIDKYELTTTKFSVVIPFRNEAKNLPILLDSISKLNYPSKLVEFIFVDDDSSDDSVEIIKKMLPNVRMTFQLLKNKRTSNSPKKDAITTAISVAKNEWIVTTDADCFLPEKWLKTLDAFIQKNHPKMVVAPVNYQVKNNFLEQFQLLDFMSMQGTTIGSFGMNFPFLCNGANLAYRKNDFFKLNGFDGNDTMASGDDVFLFEKFIESDKKSVQYLKSKDAIVTTFPVKNWSDLINQRTRWAAKTSHFNSLKVKLIGLIVLLMNLFTIFCVFTGSLKLILISLGLKIIIDWFLLKKAMLFFNQKINFMKWYIPTCICHPFFSIYVIFLTLTSKYHWKGRKYKK